MRAPPGHASVERAAISERFLAIPNNSNTHTSFGAWSPVHARARRADRVVFVLRFPTEEERKRTRRAAPHTRRRVAVRFEEAPAPSLRARGRLVLQPSPLHSKPSSSTKKHKPTVLHAPLPTLGSACAACGARRALCTRAPRLSSGSSTWSRASARSPVRS